MSDLRCVGCGSVIQTTHADQAGYVPNSVLDKHEGDIICRRCFRLKHYNEVTPLAITQEDFYRVISTIGSTDALVVNIVDVFDLEGSIVPQIRRLTNQNDLIVIANKRDLLPKSVKDAKLIHHIRHIVAQHQLKPLDVLLMSATKRHNLDHVMDVVMEQAKGRDIYVVGATNVGKSTFINAILKSYAEAPGDVITVSQHGGTTLDMIRIPIGDAELIDTPGILNDIQLTHHISKKALTIITPTKEIKPKVYQLNAGQTLFFNGFARVDFKSGAKTSFVCYLADRVLIHRTKLENADNLYQTRRYEVLAPPYEGDPFELKRVSLSVVGKQDLVLPGLGFITIQGPIAIDVYVHNKTTPYLREALI